MLIDSHQWRAWDFYLGYSKCEKGVDFLARKLLKPNILV